MACTTKELREILQIAGPNLHVASEVLQPSAADKAEMAAVRMKRRLHETLSKAVAQANPRQVMNVMHDTNLSTVFCTHSDQHLTTALASDAARQPVSSISTFGRALLNLKAAPPMV